MKKNKTDYILDPEMQNAIERNYRRAYGESFKAREERLLKQKRKDKILSIFIGLFIIASTCLLIISCSNMTKKAVDNCVYEGNSYNYCINKLG